LFESFHRAKNVGNIPGTGLGLAIVKKSVELHEGKITLNSKVGVGTTFTVTIPYSKER
jgi:signal transduction histidine kinase